MVEMPTLLSFPGYIMVPLNMPGAIPDRKTWDYRLYPKLGEEYDFSGMHTAMVGPVDLRGCRIKVLNVDSKSLEYQIIGRK
jgi:hypothetical protein